MRPILKDIAIYLAVVGIIALAIVKCDAAQVSGPCSSEAEANYWKNELKVSKQLPRLEKAWRATCNATGQSSITCHTPPNGADNSYQRPGKTTVIDWKYGKAGQENTCTIPGWYVQRVSFN